MKLDLLSSANASVPQPTRRQTMQWVLAAVAASAIPARNLFADNNSPPAPVTTRPTNTTPTGYGGDPLLTKLYAPGDVWPLTFNEAQKKCATALADAIIPADDLGPAASSVNVPAMVDDWISAPYPQQQGDRGPVLALLTWVDAESQKRFQKHFAELSPQQQHKICDDICYQPKAKPEHREAADHFDNFRNLVAGAYFATPEGWKAIGYVGNVALEQFDGPPQEVLEKLAVTQTVV